MWLYHGAEFNEELIGSSVAFVYLITNLKTNRKYIGKKLFKFKKTKQVKTKKKRILVDSDWKDYWSSSEELKKDVSILGPENFKREILHLCPNKGTASYLEAKEQFANLVLEQPELWYNAIINCRVHRNHVKI